MTTQVIVLTIVVAVVVVAGCVLLWLIRPELDVEEVCIEDGCARPATHERFEEMVGDDVMTVLICRRHAKTTSGWRRS